jgi:insertion element IS1 protein InsB
MIRYKDPGWGASAIGGVREKGLNSYTDFLKVSASVIPQEQHTALGKETGETAHVERWNNTLRQRLARFVRMTLSFSKSEVMHEACLLLFLHRYNTEQAILLK